MAVNEPYIPPLLVQQTFHQPIRSLAMWTLIVTVFHQCYRRIGRTPAPVIVGNRYLKLMVLGSLVARYTLSLPSKVLEGFEDAVYARVLGNR